MEEKLGSVGKVGKLHLLSLSSIIDVSEAGLAFLADENARRTEAVSSVCFFSEEPVIAGSCMLEVSFKGASPSPPSRLSGVLFLSSPLTLDKPDRVSFAEGIPGGEETSVLPIVTSSDGAALTAADWNDKRLSIDPEG